MLLILGFLVVRFAQASAADTGTVVRIVDGDTLVVKYRLGERRVRLLNVDTPETKDPNAPVECLGPEATAEIKRLLPEGTEVRLEFDGERVDRYGRDLAAVFLPDGRLVNAELARLGLGIAVQFGSNQKYLSAVQAAQDEARLVGRGFYDATESCTLPAQVASATQAAEELVAQSVGNSSASAAVALAGLTASVATATKLAAALPRPHKELFWLAHSVAERTAFHAALTSSVNAGNERLAKMSKLVESRQVAEEQARRQAAAAKAQAQARAAAQKKAAKRAAVQRAAARKAAEAQASATRNAAARAAAAKTAKPKSPRSPSKPASGTSTNPYPGYNGPRCYAPGGKTWKPC